MEEVKEPVKILLVEDSQSSRLIVEFLIRIFQMEKYEVIGVGTLKMCMELVATKIPKIILLDLSLMDSDVEETINSIPALVHFAPVIVISFYDDIATQEKCKKAGAAHFIDKAWLNLEHKEKLREIIDFYVQ